MVSVFLPYLLHLHSLSLGDLSPFHSLKYHLCVNDSQIYITLTFPLIYILISNCLLDISIWTFDRHLELYYKNVQGYALDAHLSATPNWFPTSVNGNTSLAQVKNMVSSCLPTVFFSHATYSTTFKKI